MTLAMYIAGLDFKAGHVGLLLFTTAQTSINERTSSIVSKEIVQAWLQNQVQHNTAELVIIYKALDFLTHVICSTVLFVDSRNTPPCKCVFFSYNSSLITSTLRVLK